MKNLFEIVSKWPVNKSGWSVCRDDTDFCAKGTRLIVGKWASIGKGVRIGEGARIGKWASIWTGTSNKPRHRTALDRLSTLPQSLSNRPIIVNDNRVITIQVKKPYAENPYTVITDGVEVDTAISEPIVIRKSDKRITILHERKSSNGAYLNMLREKLNWQLQPGK
jgi:hypothetical protein